MKKFVGEIIVLLCLILAIFAYPLNLKQTEQKWIFYDRHNEILYSEKQFFVPEKWENDFLKKALISLEDKNFYNHQGVDFASLVRAGWQNLQAQKTISGASTIPMQVGRMLFLPQAPRNYWYKFRQIFYALKLDFQLSKDEILTLYLEKINFGNGAIGVSAAAQKYFSKNPANLSIGETATLLAIIQNPANFNPISQPQKSLSRRNFLLKRFWQGKLLTQDEYDFWRTQPLKLKVQVQGEITAPHFVFWVRNQLAKYNFPDSEIHVYTTLDKKLYEKSRKISREIIKTEGQKRHISNSATVVLDQENKLRVMLGGIDFFDEEKAGEVNLAVASRQTGSTLKPFLYTLAIENGASPLQAVHDEKKVFEQGYIPRNFYVEEENGRVRFREALANSYNISAVWLLQKLGKEKFYNFCQKELGLELNDSAQNLGLALILGAGESSLLNLTRAYSVFTHQGKMTEVQFFREIKNQDGKILLQAPKPKKKTVFSLNSAEWGQHVLSDQKARWKNFARGNHLELPFPSGAKTGTSQEFKDNWVLGFSPIYTVGVWAGNNNGAAMYSTSGLQGAGPIWHRTMEMLHPKFRGNFLYHGDRQTQMVCRRPNETACTEKVQAFLLPNEKNPAKNTEKNEKLRMVYPSAGDVFYQNSDLLIQTRGSTQGKIRYFHNSREIFSPIIKNLPSGESIIEIRDDQTQQRVQILVK